MEMKLYHAEKLLENLDFFIESLDKKINDPWSTRLGYDKSVLNRLIADLNFMDMYIRQYHKEIKQNSMVSPHLLPRLKDMSASLIYQLNNDETDSLFVFTSHFNTICSGVKALEW